MEIASVARPQNIGMFIVFILWRLGVEGSNSILSFSVENATSPYMTGSYLTLGCLANKTPNVIEIRRTNPKISLSRSQGGRILKYTMPSVTCEEIGIYECIVDDEETRTTDIALSDCGPRLCYDDGVRKTIFVNINETVQFSFCVVAYMGIHSYLTINSLVIKNSSVANNSIVTKNSTWSWNYVKINSSRGESSRFNITLRRDRVTIEDYGLQVIRVSASSGTLYFLDYNITLQPGGPSECPTNITVKGQGLDYILLSWIPALDGGSSHNFSAYYSTDNETWQNHTTDVEDASVNITGLQANTIYYFKVVSSNEHTGDVNETVCDNMISATTGDRSEKDKNQIDSHPVRLGVLVLTGVLLGFLVLFLLFISWRLKISHNRQTQHGGSSQNRTRSLRRHTHNQPARDRDAQSDDSRPHNARQLNPGEYISEEGLKYVTLAEIKKCRWGKGKSTKKSQQDKTEYIELDFSLTGRIRLHGEETRAENI